MKKLLTIIAASLILSACASTGTKPASIKEGSNASSNGTQANGLTQAQIDAQKLADEIQQLRNQSIYFDFDRSKIKPQYEGVVNKQSEFVKSHSNDIVTLEGNCDERGSSEYNLALGQRRADAVLKDMVLLGVKASQIKTVSFGEEKPRLTCHAERCWKENRRVDFDHKSNS
jgi:peptidoglycan-associated lipoprotein